MTNFKSVAFGAALSIIIVTVVLMFADIVELIYFGFFIGPFRANHWFVWIGTLYIAFALPIIAISKRLYPGKFLLLLRMHIFGNLLAFLLISLHFVGQISRPAEFYPDLGTGLALYIIMILLVSTGFIHKFNMIPRINSPNRKLVHVGLSFSFYIIIVIHILHGLGFF